MTRTGLLTTPITHHDEQEGANATEGTDAETHQTSYLGLGSLSLPGHQGEYSWDLPKPIPHFSAEQLHRHLTSGCHSWHLSQSTVNVYTFPAVPYMSLRDSTDCIRLALPGTCEVCSMSAQQCQPLPLKAQTLTQHLHS